MFDEEKIKSFSTTDMRIYNYILKHSIQFPYMSIRELADEIPTSTASIMRFVKKMGYDSFPELKYAYKKEEKEVSLYMVNDLDETIDCLKKFNTPYYQDLFKEVAYVLGNANMIIFDGMGDSGKIAEYAARRFSTNGFFSAALTDPYQGGYLWMAQILWLSCYLFQETHLNLLEKLMAISRREVL